MQGPATGEAIAELIVNGKASHVDLQPFSPDRFLRRHKRQWNNLVRASVIILLCFRAMILTGRILSGWARFGHHNVIGVRVFSGVNDMLSVVEIMKTGSLTERQVSLENIIQTSPKKIPLRDIRLLLRTQSSSVKKIPSLLPRPSSSCFILDIEHIRVLCFSDKVISISNFSNYFM